VFLSKKKLDQSGQDYPTTFFKEAAQPSSSRGNQQTLAMLARVIFFFFLQHLSTNPDEDGHK